jgi:hypothetical protein
VHLALSFGFAIWVWLDTFAVLEFFTGLAILDTTTMGRYLITGTANLINAFTVFLLLAFLALSFFA